MYYKYKNTIYTSYISYRKGKGIFIVVSPLKTLKIERGFKIEGGNPMTFKSKLVLECTRNTAKAQATATENAKKEINEMIYELETQQQPEPTETANIENFNIEVIPEPEPEPAQTTD